MTFLEAFVAIAVAFVGGGALVAFVNSRTERWKFLATRKAAKEDKAEAKADEMQKIKEALEKFERAETRRNEELEARLTNIENQNAAQSEALKLILLDRIQHLGQSYIAKGEISFDNRRRLHDMHKCYHSGLDGNGDADLVMDGVDELPLSN